MALETFKTAVIGCGMISEMYLKNLCNFFKITDVVGCSDIIPERSKKRSDQFNIKQMTNEEIYRDPEIQIVVNLTDPPSHYEVTKNALNAGKHVYCEKMMAVTLAEGEELHALAKEKKLAYTTAPDTFLGQGMQTARWILDSGMIGTPVAVNGICQRGYLLDRDDDWIRMIHRPGGGIPFDMGGYYLHVFVDWFGPIEKVTGFAKTVNEHRK
ncbi:MAG: Gfo/Idh/MocA family oxidoreductase, partial [Treponema sp.]|nr:Gfo/Idh/MocA family oxidoreductase [Treponema sp.]